MLNLQSINFFLNITPFSITDITEIMILTILIYYFSLWLKGDNKKDLLGYFYAYGITMFITYYFQFPIIPNFLFITSPIAIIILIILHQKTLQKNYIAYKRISYQTKKITYWFDELVKSCFIALNKKKEIVCLLERNYSISDFIKTPFTFYADIEKKLFEIILENQILNNNYMIWLNNEGKLVAINTMWNFDIETDFLTNEMIKLAPWKQKSIFITYKTDAIIFKINPTSRTFDIIVKGKIVEQLNSTHAIDILEKEILRSDITQKKENKKIEKKSKTNKHNMNLDI